MRHSKNKKQRLKDSGTKMGFHARETHIQTGTEKGKRIETQKHREKQRDRHTETETERHRGEKRDSNTSLRDCKRPCRKN